MFARVTKFKIRPEKTERATKLYKDSVLPAAREQRGYEKAVVMINRQTGEGRSITFWTTEEDALANEKGRYYQQQLIKFMNLFTTDPVREGFEVMIQDSVS